MQPCYSITTLSYFHMRLTCCVIVGVSNDKSLVDILASLAAETTHDLTIDDIDSATSQVMNVDDIDCVLSQVVLPLSAEDKRRIEEESLEMSQRVWDEDAAAAAAADDDDDEMYVL